MVAFPFTGDERVKQRPALVVLDSGDADLVVARVTTHPERGPNDITLTDWREAGLLAASVARVDKLATLERALVARQLGSLSPADANRLVIVLRRLFL